MSKTKITHQDNMKWWLTTLSRVIDVVDDKSIILLVEEDLKNWTFLISEQFWFLL